MHKYDYSFLKKEIPGNIVGLSEIIADLKAKEEFRKLQYISTFEELQKKAVIESVKGSNAIEGIVTTDDRIKDIVDGMEPLSHDEVEISGYKDALNLIHNNHADLDLDETMILQFHEMMLSGVSNEEAGHYKKIDNYIMEYFSDGTRNIRFKPVKAKETQKAIEQMLLAYYDARQDSEISPILLIPCVILDFLCIHPFRDGNGRVSRLITVLLLYMNGYDIVRYISFEGQINKYKEAYYDALKQSSYNWHESQNDYIPFIINFMQILYRCFKDLDEHFMDISIKKAKKTERVEAVLMSAVVPVSKSDILEKLPDVSVKTVELVLGRMVKDKRVVKIGSYRDARYKRNEL